MHGLIGEFHALFRWQQLAQFLSRDEAFQHRYKIYLARYNTQASAKDMTESFSRALRDWKPSGGLTIVAISLSGTIVRNAMRDPAVDQSISRVLTLGSFFRGSPLFCSDWMLQTIANRHLSPLCRFDRWLAYKLYFSRHKNLLIDYRWDNSDGQMPEIRTSRSQADLETKLNSPRQTQLMAPAQQPVDHKFVVYAGYLHNQYIPTPHGSVYAFLYSPFTFFWTTLPAQLGREQAALRFINHLIAEAVPAAANKSDIIYPLNDGISPISSSLLLSNDFVAHVDLGDEDSIRKIGKNSSAKKARLFDNTDHLTFIQGPRSSGSSADVTDVLSPTEKPRPIFAWILKDLME
jgi:hypothetical protein